MNELIYIYYTRLFPRPQQRMLLQQEAYVRKTNTIQILN
jgi:hypothetical protein